MTNNWNDCLIAELAENVNQDGLSFLSLIRIMKKYGYDVKGYRDKKPYYDAPYLMFDSKKKHYYLIMQFDDKYCYMYDPNIGDLKIYRKLFKSFWCQYYLTICYNKAE